MGNRYTYTDEFKRGAVEYARSSDQPRYKIAESLGVSDASLANWIRDADRDAQHGALVRERPALARLLDHRLAAIEAIATTLVHIDNDPEYTELHPVRIALENQIHTEVAALEQMVHPLNRSRG